jgi:dipeptidyl aminopeptidase/acylaminoacyl peptidase
MYNPLPKNRVWLAHGVSEVSFDDTGRSLFYVRSGDARRNILRQDLGTGLVEYVTAEPPPGGTVGYGGGSYATRGDLLVYAAEGALVALRLDTGEQKQLTPKYEGLGAPALSPCGRFAAFIADLGDQCDVLLVDTEGAALPVKLSAGPWFAANPTFSPDGARVAWMEWDSAHMPWEQSLVRVARLARATLDARAPAEVLPLAAETTLSKPDVSYANPQFSPDGSAFAYTSDESGWRSLYIAAADGSGGERIDTGVGEIGGPDWVQGQFAVRWGKDGRSVYAVRRHRSTHRLVRVALPERAVEELESLWDALDDPAVHPGEPDVLAYAASGSKRPPVLVTRREGEETARSSAAVGLVDPAGLTAAEVIEWPTVDGVSAYGVYYPALKGDGPRPLLVMVHGGPTSESPMDWNPEAQYYAGRGWHVLEVNHRGGTGSGRAYQDMLHGAWGVVDVEDARTGAEHLIGRGVADHRRVAITGGSAGGYTTLMALAKDPHFWAAGVSLYGVGNLYDLKQGSHRFEVNYEETIVGPLPEHAERWVERSALTHVGEVRSPVLLFHGKEDKAVPWQQSEEFAEAVRRGGGVAELVLYDDEGHGFRKEKNRRDQQEKMEAFLEKYVIHLQGRR